MDKKDKKATKEYPGVATNIADKGKVSTKLVDEETKSMNNNPRNSDM